MSTTFDTSHVRNVGEFFSQHYLDAVLERDLEGKLKEWASAEGARGPRSPDKALAALADRYFRTVARLADREELGEDAVGLLAEHHARVLEALGYAREPLTRELPDGTQLPLSLELCSNGRPFLWIGEAGFGPSFDLSEDDSPLVLPPLTTLPATDAPVPTLPSWAALLDGPVFRQDHAPRWVLLLAGPDVFLIDRDRWPQGRYLHFDLGAMLGHRNPAALRAFAGLLHREVLAPESIAQGGRSLLDELDEKSHKHAFAVSTDLKFGVQKAIEILGNEVLHHRRTVAKQGVFDKPELAAELSRECIRYMYRLLFLFYVEARGGEVETVPVKSEVYRKGLSLERLRDLELVPLTTDKARNGYYLQLSLERLFDVIHLGWPKKAQQEMDKLITGAMDLQVPPQRSPLFDRSKTPLITSAKLRNAALQKILRLLSLSKEGARSGSGRQRGRISYAQLGINQLGAVYEGLLSYSGFFANETLQEVKRSSDKGKDGSYEQVYYVPASRVGDFKTEELVFDPETGRPLTHEKGSFLFRLAGRDREKSASYYTPEVLTACLTKYTLKERLGEAGSPGALTADEILDLTICEPAMGSGAFLSEAVSQLAHAYLTRKQAELGLTIAAEDYQREWTRVKYHFVAHRVYGVDLNPLAAELAKVSLWLGVLDPELQAPFMDTRLVAGNSLIGARRAVYTAAQLSAAPTGKHKHDDPNWWDAAPRALVPGEARPSGTIYHFLVPNAGMAPYDKDKVVASLCKAELAQLKAWHKAMQQPFTPMEMRRLQALSDAIDSLWALHARTRGVVSQRLAQPVPVWGKENAPQSDDKTISSAASRHKTVEECTMIVAGELRPNGPGAKLKAVMDLWCSLWMWPLASVASLPTREAWLAQVDTLLSSGPTEAQRAANEGRFIHWELEFADVFSTRGGFDLVLGNPPWVKLEWKESGILGDLEPMLDVRDHSAKQVADLRAGVLEKDDARAIYLAEFSSVNGVQAYLNSGANYAQLRGVQTNLYKCFMTLAWSFSNATGMCGLLHQSGVYEDPNGGGLRAQLFGRARLLAWATNELKLFAEVNNGRPYSWSVTSGSTRSPAFTCVANLLHPRTLDGCFEHDGIGPVPGIKDESGNWDLRPHRKRLVHVDADALALFAKLYDEPGTPPEQARLPVVHSQDILEVLRRFADAPLKLGDLQGEYFCTVCFDETGRQQDGTIRRETRFPKSAAEWVVSGPHFYVGTPFNKTPNEGCSHNKDYTPLDLTQIADDYLPRTNYVPGVKPAEYLARTPKWNGEPVTTRYRHVQRRMLAPTGERTLISALLPPGVAHVNTVLSATFSDESLLLLVSAMASSLPVDFFFKSTGKSDLYGEAFGGVPLPRDAALARAAIQRALQLNCLTTHYADLYNRNLPKASELLPSANPDPRCARWDKLPRTWNRDAALRTPYARRQALVELDALAALSLNLSLDQLILLYQVQFPILQQYERETFYDQRGKIVFTTNRGLTGVGLDRKPFEALQQHLIDSPNAPLPKEARDAQGPFVPPFNTCSREADLTTAYHFFRDRLR